MISRNSKLRTMASFTHIFNTDQATIKNIIAENSFKTPVLNLFENKILLKDNQEIIFPEKSGQKGDVLVNDGTGRLSWSQNKRVVDLFEIIQQETETNKEEILNEVMIYLLEKEAKMKVDIQELIRKKIEETKHAIQEDHKWDQQNYASIEPSPLTLPRSDMSQMPTIATVTSLSTLSPIPQKYVIQGTFTIPSSAGNNSRIFLPLSIGEGKGSREAQPVGIAPFRIRPMYCHIMRVFGKGTGLSYSLSIERRSAAVNQNILVGSSYANGNLVNPIMFKYHDSAGYIENGEMFYMILTSHSGDPGTPLIYYTMVFEKIE